MAFVFCKKCGRPLTNELSRHIGIGPVCLGKKHRKKQTEDEITLDLFKYFETKTEKIKQPPNPC